MFCPVLSDHCLSVCLVCNVGVLWLNGCMDQDETWYAGRSWLWPHCVRWGHSSPAPKGHSPPVFGPCLLWSNGWIDQDATLYIGRPWPRPHCVRWGPSSPAPSSLKMAQAPMSVVAKRSPIRATAEHLFSAKFM